MITPKNWRRAGSLIFSVLVGTSRADFSGPQLCLDAEGLEVYLAGLKGGWSDAVTLSLVDFRLSDLPLKMKNLFPDLTYLELTRPLAPIASPTSKDVAGAVPCTKTVMLGMYGSFGSPGIVEWLRLLFPNITSLSMDTEALPLQTPSDINAWMCMDLTMEKIISLTLGGSSTAICSIFENLKLFPNLEFIRFGPISDFSLEIAWGTDLVMPLVSHIDIHTLSPSRACLSRFPSMFPLLRTLDIRDSSLQELIRPGPSVPVSPFRFVETLDIFSRPAKCVFLGGNMADVFPSLSIIKLTCLHCSVDSSPRGLTKPLKTVKALTIMTALGSIGHLPDFFSWLFPNLESLTMIGCCLQQFSRSPSPFFEHVHLRHLDISCNADLNGVLGAMCPGPLNVPQHAALGRDYLEAMIAGLPVSTEVLRAIRSYRAPPIAGLHLPALETLDIRWSFYHTLPRYFFHGCPNIKVLKISFDLSYGQNRVEWWSFLEVLTGLEILNVEFGQNASLELYSLEEWQGFSGNTAKDIVGDLTETLIEVRKSLNLRTKICLFNEEEDTDEPVAIIEYEEESEVPNKKRRTEG